LPHAPPENLIAIDPVALLHGRFLRILLAQEKRPSSPATNFGPPGNMDAPAQVTQFEQNPHDFPAWRRRKS
jgi:hypothetical protein